MTPEEIAELPYRPCVGVVLANTRGEIFVGQRFETEKPAWQMPQGGIDPGESPREAAIRELREETGVTEDLVRIEGETADWVAYDLPHDIVPRIWKGRFRGQKQKWFLFRFLGEDAQVNILTDHPEFSEWRWLAADQVVDQIVPFKRQVYQAVMEELKAYL